MSIWSRPASPFHRSYDLPPLTSGGIGFFFEGTPGDDAQAGSSGGDVFDYSQGGNDLLDGLEGDDTFLFGAEFDFHDQVNGGIGYDVLVLDGDYSGSAFQWTNTTLVNVEEIDLVRGNDYHLFTNQGAVAAGATLIIDASELGSGNSFSIATDFETDGNYVMYGGNGGDHFLLGTGADEITGRGGFDSVTLDGHFLPSKVINGGASFDDVGAVFSASDTISLANSNLTNVELLNLMPDSGVSGVAVTLTTADGNVAKNQTLIVHANGFFGALAALTFDGSAETNGRFELTDTMGNDFAAMGAKDDLIDISLGGIDTVFGNDGNDLVFAGAEFDNVDLADGGAGEDTLELGGDYSAGFTFEIGSIFSIEILLLDAGNDYFLTIVDEDVAAGERLTLDASHLLSADDARFDGSAETNARLTLIGGGGDDDFNGGALADTMEGRGGDDSLNGHNGADILMGGAGSDTLDGLDGADTLIGGGGSDFYDYGVVTQSTGRNHDDVVGFDFTNDIFQLTGNVRGINAEVETGELNDATFNADLAAAIGAGELTRKHAVLFTPDSGTLAGVLLLIVDANGVAGYQANKDYVFTLTDPISLGQLSKGDFTLSS